MLGRLCNEDHRYPRNMLPGIVAFLALVVISFVDVGRDGLAVDPGGDDGTGGAR